MFLETLLQSVNDNYSQNEWCNLIINLISEKNHESVGKNIFLIFIIFLDL